MDTAGTESTGGFRLLRYFSIASLIALVLAVVGLAFFFREIAIKQVVKVGEEMNVNLSIAFANVLRQDYIPLITVAEKSTDAEVKASAAVAAVHKAVTEAARETHVVKVAIHDLKGRTIGFSVGGFEDALLRAMLGTAGLALSDVTLVNVNFSLSPALLAGRVDGVIGAFRNF